LSIDAVLRELSAATGADYVRFRVERERSEMSGPYINAGQYKSKLSGLVNRLQEEYGLGPAQPTHPGSGAVTLNLNQTLSQLTHITLSVELEGIIEDRMRRYPENSKERTFLERLRGSLGASKTPLDSSRWWAPPLRQLG
jgi:hypothetical protein